MREILFRGKRCGNGEWVYGSLLIQSGEWISKDEQAPTEYRILGCRGENYLVDPKTVGEYTGLTDKNGTKIFEGDICKAYICMVDTVEKEVIGTICFEDGAFEFKCEHDSVYIYSLLEILEVIGNVHDNSDLLEGKA